MKKIAACSLEEQQSLLGASHTEVHVQYEDGHRQKLFSYYADEMTFTTEEFVGLTRDEAMALFYERDKRFLQS